MLEKFGFTPTEIKVYQSLLRLGTTTGYAVALDLGIARANVYQSLEALVRRGAARKSASSPVQYSASGPAALLSQLERSFRRDLTDLEAELEALPIAGGGGTAELELLTSADQLLARAASCADAARTEILTVTGPWADAMNLRFPAAANRKVQVRGVSLAEIAPDGMGARAVPPEELLSYWGGFPVAILADRSRAVFGVLQDREGSGVATTAPGAVPFLRHLLRRELSLST